MQTIEVSSFLVSLIMEQEPAAKRARLSTEDILRELDDPMADAEEDMYEDDGPMAGSDDEFEDLQVEEEDSDWSESDAD